MIAQEELNQMAKQALVFWKFGALDTHIKKGLEAIIARPPSLKIIEKFFTRSQSPDWDGLEELAIYLAEIN